MSRLRLVGLAACYVLALAIVAIIAFGESMFFARGTSAGPARTGAYGGRIPMVAPVDGQEIALAITEATGGPPTIGMQLPPDRPATAATTTTITTKPVASISVMTTPTYTAVTRTSTRANWYSLLSLIPSNLRFPPRSSPHRR
jgi:hypothetical protein